MQLSRFTLIVEHFPKAHQHVAFNTRTHALIKINDELKELLENLPSANGAAARWTAELSELRNMGILVKDTAEDTAKLDDYLRQKKFGVKGSSYTATILTTYNCNLACTYCFEESTRTRASVKLDLATSDLIIGWLKNRVAELKVEKLYLVFYGGEPLLNKTPIEYISNILKPWCEARGLGYQFCLQTNGVLLTPELVAQYIPLGLDRVRITVDGTKEAHDRRRVFRGSGKGSFDTVMQNIIASVDNIKIEIGGGYDAENVDEIVAFFDYLEEIKIIRKLKGLVFSPTHPTLGPKGNADQIQLSGCMSNYQTDTLLETTAKIKAALRAKGFPEKSAITTTMCPLVRENGGATIDCHGQIFKCNSMLGHPEFAVGHVRDRQFSEQQYTFMNHEAWKECDPACPYVPICNGGCRLFAFFKHKDFGRLACEKDYMDRMMPEAVKEEYRRMTAAPKEVAWKPEPALR